MNRRHLLIALVLLLLVPVSAIAQDSGNELVSVDRPWNGYWWPHLDGGLATGIGYENQPSPYIKYAHIFDPYRLAVKWEIDHHYDPDGEAWAGHCNGWAAAAVSEAQPPIRSVVEDTEFFYGDMTGLYTELYQGSTGARYGERYFNESDDFSDIDPLVFQQTIELYLKINGIPVIADVDPDVEVWSYPIYAYNKTWFIEGSVKHVTMEVRYASDLLAHPDESAPDDYVEVYSYDIQLDGSQNEVSAEWTNNSVQNHPDFLWYPDVPGAFNPYVSLNDALSIANAPINDGVDDRYEENDTADMAVPFSGEVYARLLDEDWFAFTLDPGSSGEIVLSTREWGLADDWKPLLFNGSGAEQGPFVQAADGSWRAPVDAATALSWKVQVPQRIGYTGNYMIQLVMDSVSGMVPVFPTGGDTDAAVVTWNRGAEAQQAAYCTWTAPGSTHSYGSSLMPSLGVATYRFDGSNPFDPVPDWLRLVVSDVDVTGYVRLDNGTDQTMGLYRPVSASRDILVAHVPTRRHFWDLALTMINTDRAATTTMRVHGYNHDGEIQATTYRELDPAEKWTGSLDELFTGFDTTSISHVMGRATSPVSTVLSYRTTNGRELGMVPAVTAELGGAFTIPLQVLDPSEAGWEGLVLMNTEDSLARLEMKWYSSDDWRPIAETTVYVENHGNLVTTLDALVPETAGDVSAANRIEIQTSNTRMQGFLLVGNHGATRLSSVELLPEGQNLDTRVIAVPVLAAHEQQRVVLQNFELTPRNVLFRTLNAAGTQVGSAVVRLSGGERRILNRADWPVSEGYEAADIHSVEVQKDDNIFWWVRIAGEDARSMEILVR